MILKKELLKIITEYKFVFSVVKIRLNKIAYKLLPFKIFNHLFHCHRGSKSVGKCKYCTRFYVEESDHSYYIEKCFTIYKSALVCTSVGNLATQVSAKSFTLSLYGGLFLDNDTMFQNFREIFVTATGLKPTTT